MSVLPGTSSKETRPEVKGLMMVEDVCLGTRATLNDGHQFCRSHPQSIFAVTLLFGRVGTYERCLDMSQYGCHGALHVCLSVSFVQLSTARPW